MLNYTQRHQINFMLPDILLNSFIHSYFLLINGKKLILYVRQLMEIGKYFRQLNCYLTLAYEVDTSNLTEYSPELWSTPKAHNIYLSFDIDRIF